VFWEDIYLLATITEPFAAMMCQPGGATAEVSILLSYANMPHYIAMLESMTRGHWKIFRTATLALLQRILPIVVGASVTVRSGYCDNEGCTVEFSVPMSIITIVWMAAYLVLIPYEVLEPGYTRHLPRVNITIGDLLSWSCSSRLLRGHNLNIVPEGEDSEPLAEETGLLAGNPLDVFGSGRQSERWFMEARLRLAQQRFSFGLEEISSKPGKFTIGIKSVTKHRTTPFLGRKSEGLRKGFGRGLEELGGCSRVMMMIRKTNRFWALGGLW